MTPHLQCGACRRWGGVRGCSRARASATVGRAILQAIEAGRDCPSFAGAWTKADRRRAHEHLSGARILGGRIGPHGEHVLAEVAPERAAEAAAMHAEYIAAIRAATASKNTETAAHFRRQADENADSLSEDDRAERREHLLEMAVRFDGYAAESRRAETKLRALAARIRAEGMPPPVEDR